MIGNINKWSIKICSRGIFIYLGRSSFLVASHSLIGHCLNHVVPKSLLLLDHHELITATGFTGLSNGFLFKNNIN